VPFEELKPSLDAAYKKINQQVSVPGFRKGKIPARVIDQRFGRGAVLEEAINDALPKFYTEAVNDGELNVLGQPDVDITEFNDGDELKFTAEVDIRPSIEIPDFSGIEVVVDAVEVPRRTSRSRWSSCATGSPRPPRSSAPPPRATWSWSTWRPVSTARLLADGVASGVSYTIGSGQLLDGIDEAVTGKEKGATATFTSDLKGGSAAGREATVKVVVSDVQERELPALDDDFAQLASEFDTIEELREDSRKRLAKMKSYDQATQAQERVLDALIELVDVPVPEKLLKDEVETRAHNMEHHQFPAMGLDWDSYLEREGKTREEYDAELEEQRSRASGPSSSSTNWSTRRSCRSTRKSSPSTCCAARPPPA